ncbi:hypothetical protein SH501x_003087 [Pirellulaceae bacterium SH501]
MSESKPLSVRLDPLGEGAPERGSSSFAFELPAAGGNGFSFPLPIYSRVIHDGQLSAGLAEVLTSACSEHRIPWLDSNNPRSSDSAGRVAAIEIDTPVDIESLEYAAAVQLQFYGIPFQRNAANRYSRWKPAMPIEVRAIEDLAHKVDAIRTCCKPGTSVGAAIIASEATIYEDVRFMVDSGIDWIEIVQSPFYDLLPQACLTFDDVSRCVAKGVKARNDAKRVCPLWLTASSILTTDWLRWFEQGIQAISIDPYLANQRPVHNVPRDTLAGIRVQTANPQTAHLWIHDSVKEIADQMADLVLFRS